MTFWTKTDLYPHQRTAVNKLLPVRVGGLFMEMGTGKTLSAIELVSRRQYKISNVIWFCPVGLKSTIDFEIRKHTDCQSIYVFDDKTNMQNVPDSLWYIIGIESMSSSNRMVLTANALINENSFVIVDESSYIKGHDSLRTKRITLMSERAKYRLILTGTPMSQGVVDLYAQMRFLSSKILGYNSFYSFAHNHLEYSEKYPGLIIRAHNTGLLASKIQPYVYQVTKEECLDLPDKLFDSRYFDMTYEQSQFYQQAKDEILLDIKDGEIDSYTIFRLFTALQQITSGYWNHPRFRYEFQHLRLETLCDIIKSIPQDKKIIIWCKFIYSIEHIIKRLRDEFGYDSVSCYYGKLGEKERDKEIEKFRNEARFFIATMQTGGHGLTLNESHYVIFYENTFKYADRLQAEDRCHRIGQPEKVTYIDIVCRSGIERRIQESMTKKSNVIQDFKCKVDKVKDMSKRNLERFMQEL